ncbi:hypothetical protein [Streptomyces roseifaciens]|uniref:hypothetical protein n=1 Tax=Streptomyces roseifaciens TaxID=1488406 RepID=UPI000717F007|nr:hypothetical protein [Streptomyces roseifaciens]
MPRRTLLVATALTAALTVPGALPGAGAAALAPTELSNADNRRTVSVTTGDEIRIHLTVVRGKGEKWVWDAPKASSADVLNETESKAAPDGDATAAFTASHAGSSAITAHRRCVATEPHHACAHAVRTWKVTIKVN